jgi:type II restriction/modification system DNA methylase subunit YeeA
MNRNKLKQYAPQARRDFIAAVTDRAAYYGLTKQYIQPITEQGDVALIGGKPFPRKLAEKRKRLEGHIKQRGFEQVMEAMAYTWFNRLVAIRFMELHGYLDHGYRVLSHTEGKPTPEILEHAEHVDLPGLKKEMVIDLKLAGNKEGELYRLLLTAQCNGLHTAMPFLFEKIDDETELLLPDNLLHSDSLIRELVREIDEEDWQEVEIIGWLYQFYISEKKDQVIGKVVASEDIPAATQLFTPNWIVKYLVQNTLGRQWLATYPQSALRQQMEYYIEPAEQTPEVQEQLKAITLTSLNPEELTLLDPACGSGHILVEAYDLFKAIYQERGYRARDIPALILQKNLFGLEIDDRAAQLAAFALMMKARTDDRRIFDSEAKPNILAFQDSRGMDAADITHALNAPINKEDVPREYLFEAIEEEMAGLFSKKALAEKGHVSQADIASLLDLFENAKTFGSLIQIPPKLAAMLPEIEKRLDDVLKYGDLTHASAHVLKPLLQQARLLSQQYDAVVANPPYMGGKYFSGKLKDFVADKYKEAKADLYACFIQRNLVFAKQNGFVGMITIPNWMFLSSFEDVRKSLFDNQTIDTFIHNGRGVFGSDFGSCSFVYRNCAFPHFRGTYRRLFDKQGSVATVDELEQRFLMASGYFASTDDLQKVPGYPIAYWLSPNKRQAFTNHSRLAESTPVRQGVATADDARFLRLWFEIAVDRLEFNCLSREDAIKSKKRWFPIVKGGPFRKWYGNHEYVVNWEFDGREIRGFVDTNGKQRSRPQNVDFYFRTGLSYSNVSIAAPSFRILEPGFIFSHVGQALFPTSDAKSHVLAFLNSKVATDLLGVLSPTTHFEVGHISALPLVRSLNSASAQVADLIAGHRQDWNSFETSWDFQSLPVVHQKSVTLRQSQEAADVECLNRFARMKELEEENNRLFIEAYGLQDELSPEVPDEQITLYRPDREKDIQRLLSYAIGCMMGRYSLDKPELIYAHSGNQSFDPSQYKTFQADDDGLIPLLEADWGIWDDATNRIVEFIGVAWPKEHLEENLKFIADSLGPNNGEQPRETIRRYLATGLYKHHLSMYKKRPIYWLFSSGKHRAFQCLVYLHRYNESTLSRMRIEYVIPLQGKISSRIGQLADDLAAASSTSHRKKLEKERDILVKQQAELRTFDETLRHYADKRISLDLDDGVKLNYGKFGDLLADVKAVTGGAEEP